MTAAMSTSLPKPMFCAICFDIVHKAYGAWFHSGPPETATIAREVTDRPGTRLTPVYTIVPLPTPPTAIPVGGKNKIRIM